MYNSNEKPKDKTYAIGLGGSTLGTLIGTHLGTKEGKRIKERLKATADRYTKHKANELSGINIDKKNAEQAYTNAKQEANAHRALLGSQFAGLKDEIHKFDVYDDRLNQPYQRFGNIQRGDLVHLDDYESKPPYANIARKIRPIEDQKTKDAMESYVKSQLKANDAQIHHKNMENLQEMKDDLMRRNRINASTFSERADHIGSKALLRKRLTHASAGKVVGGLSSIAAYKLYKNINNNQSNKGS